MIITCNNCNKNFEVDSNLISEKGRLVQCISCDHKWFFKKEILEKFVPIVKTKAISDEPRTFNDVVASKDKESTKTIKLLDGASEDIPIIEKISIQKSNKIDEVKEDDKELNIKKSINKKSYNILGLTIVFIISFIALIIVLDTFQKPISTFVPNIEFILYNLYETVNDMVLFFNDLI